MFDFLFEKNLLTLKLIPLLLMEVTIYFAFISLAYWLLRDDPASIAIVVLTSTVPILCLFYLSAQRTGLLELNVCRQMDTRYLISVTFKMTLFFWGLGFLALALAFLIWYPIISYLIPDFKISMLFSIKLDNIFSHGLGAIGVGEELQNAPLVFGTLFFTFAIITLILQILFTIPLSSLAASMDGRIEFDPISGIGSYFWSIMFTLSVGYLILGIFLINVVVGTSTIFHISLTPNAIIHDHGIIALGAAAFFMVILPASYIAALHASVSAKSYKRYINKISAEKIVFVGIKIKPKSASEAKLETMDIASLRKAREKRTH